MILGHGVDIIEVYRIEKAIERWGKHFLEYVFCPEEIEYAQKHTYPYPHYAVRFAAKEAIFKAVGDNGSLHWKDMKILKDKHGKPYCVFNKKKLKYKVQLSLSHTRKYAVASAIITK